LRIVTIASRETLIQSHPFFCQDEPRHNEEDDEVRFSGKNEKEHNQLLKLR